MHKPILGILLGDTTGVGPELIAKIAANGFLTDQCRPVIIGDVRVFENGLKIIGETAPHYVISDIDEADWSKGIPVLDMKDQNPEDIVIGKISAECGKAVLNMIKTAAKLYNDGKIEGFCFAPFNKAAMIEGGCSFESEHHLLANLFGVTGPFGEINVVGELCTTRTTSHIPIKDVSEHITVESILRAVRLSYDTVKGMGVEDPIIGVAALNPHCGENGLCGREELDIIVPAIEEAKKLGINAKGPYSSEILFIKAFNGDFDSVVTMYHDQGQIALKLKGFRGGITIAGGQPAPIVTCAHGTAYDIAGKGIVDTSSIENAVKMCTKMAIVKHDKN